jgi:predicted branched-subunit amino acid permease
MVALPAILLMVASGLSILLWLAWVAMVELGASAGALQHLPDDQRTMGIAFWVAFSVISLIASIVALYGGWKMKALESYSWALTAAIICLVPCTGPCCGLPVGIWALVVLLKPEVKAAFRGPGQG